MTLPVGLFVLFLSFRHVELAEEVERHYRVQVCDDQCHHDGQYQLQGIVFTQPNRNLSLSVIVLHLSLSVLLSHKRFALLPD